MGAQDISEMEVSIAWQAATTGSPPRAPWGGGCRTTQRGNAHRTEEREVHYPFHPWSGCIVNIHGVIKKPGGVVGTVAVTAMRQDAGRSFQCGCSTAPACAAIRVESHPCVHIAALTALRDGVSTRLITSNALICSKARITHDSNHGDSHAKNRVRSTTLGLPLPSRLENGSLTDV